MITGLCMAAVPTWALLISNPAVLPTAVFLECYSEQPQCEAVAGAINVMAPDAKARCQGLPSQGRASFLKEQLEKPE